jgi:monoamine oxidase
MVDDVVLAVPPSVWSRTRFEPELPPELRPQMGTAVKYLSVVDRRFWENERLGSKAATDGLVGATWEATAGQQGGGAVLTRLSPADQPQPLAGGAGLRTATCLD